LLDELLIAEVTHQNQAAPGGREKLISQIPPKSAARATPAIKGERRDSTAPPRGDLRPPR
jgi:hypothetical protein